MHRKMVREGEGRGEGEGERKGREKRYFKELAPTIKGTYKYEICRAALEDGDPEKS